MEIGAHKSVAFKKKLMNSDSMRKLGYFPLAWLHLFNFILSPPQPFTNSKPSFQLSFPFSFLNLFCFFDLFSLQKLLPKIWTFYLLLPWRGQFSHQGNEVVQREREEPHKKIESEPMSLFNNIQLNLFTTLHKTTETQWVSHLARGYK